MTGIDQKQRTIRTKINQTFTIKLWEDRTIAHRWHVEYDPLSLSLVDDDYHRMTIALSVDAGNRIFEFKALKAGNHQLVFTKRMGVIVTEEQRIYQVMVE